MLSKGVFISFLLAIPLALSNPLSVLRHGAGLVTRQSCVETCGSVCYWQSDIDAAQAKGYSLYQSKQTLGSDEYPHEYRDDEGFDFAASGPYQEFPILSSYKVYSGGAPGADRVVFNTRNQFAGLITHTGASGNNFKECQLD